MVNNVYICDMKITFIGAGNMGGAIAKGLIKSGVDPQNISIIDPSLGVTDFFRGLGCVIGEVIEGSLVVVAVKPWQVQSVAYLAKGSKGVISIAAGVDLELLEVIFGTKDVVRVIPNTPAEMLEGATFITGKNQIMVDHARAIFDCVGATFVVEEKLLDGCMALASCGVAYALRYARASQVGGVELGVNPALGQQIIAQTLRGAAAILEAGNHPESEIDKVTTPGGITIKGLNAMEKAGFTNAVIEGLKNSKA